MRYKVPRHVDYKAKIVGPATFSQLLYIGAVGFVILMLYFIMGASTFFYIISIMLGAGGVALAFLQIAGQPLPEYLKKMVIFSVSPREYVWEKKIVPMETAIPKRRKQKKEQKKEEEKEEQKTSRGSRLGNIASDIETY